MKDMVHSGVAAANNWLQKLYITKNARRLDK